MKILKNKRIIFFTIIFISFFSILIFICINHIKQKKELETQMPYNFEKVVLPEVNDFTDYLTNYSKTIEKISLYEKEDLTKERAELDKGQYLEVYGYKDGVSKIKMNDKFYFVKSSNIENVSKGNMFKVVKGILLVNTEYRLPSDFAPKLDKFVEKQFELMKIDANRENITLNLYRDYISYEEQKDLHRKAPKTKTKTLYAMYSSAGYNESQIGQSLDIIGKNEEKNLKEEFKETEEFNWLVKNAHKYGFILRYPENKEDKTNYKFEPWHFRYVGVENASKIFEKDITLEEFLRK